MRFLKACSLCWLYTITGLDYWTQVFPQIYQIFVEI